MKNALFSAIALLLALNAARAAEPVPPDAQAIEKAIDLAAGYLLTNAQANGEFTYRRNLNPGVRYRYKYNVLRHAGALYALGQFRDYRRPGGEKLDRMEKVISAGNSFLRECLHPVVTDGGMLAVWSAEEKMDSRALKGSPLVAKLGASGLGLLALAAESAPPADTREKMQRIARFILSMQNPDGSFISRIIAGKVDEDDFNSLYYPGEAMLGLLTLYRLDHDPLWLAAAAKAMNALATRRMKEKRYPPDHWALIASRELWRLRGEWLPPAGDKTAVAAGLTAAGLCGHAAGICEAMLAEQCVFPCLPGEDGCFRPGGLTCPTATRVEGMVSAYMFLPQPGYGDLRHRLRRACARAVNFLLKAQVKDGALAGGVPRSSTDDIIRNALGERARADEIRIDYVQHALSALMLYRTAFPGREQPQPAF